MNPTSRDYKWIKKIKINEIECVRLSFSGVLSQKQAVEACNEWTEIFGQDNARKYNVIFNATNLDNYEPLARAVFQKSIKDLRNQIIKIWVVTDSKLISGGAAIMGIFASFPIKAVSSESQIVP